MTDQDLYGFPAGRIIADYARRFPEQHDRPGNGWSELHATDVAGVPVVVRGSPAAPFGVSVTARPHDGAWVLSVTATYTGAVPAAAWLEVRAGVAASNPYFLIPGLFYGENRPAGMARRFPRFAVGAGTPDHQDMVSDRWSFRGDRAAAPVVFAWGEGGGVALAGDPLSAAGVTGLGFSYQDGTAAVHLRFPFREEPVSYLGIPEPFPPRSAWCTWQPGERRSFCVRLWTLSAGRHGYAAVLRTVHRELAGPQPQPDLDVAAAADLAAEGLLRWHFRSGPPVLIECTPFDRELNDSVGGALDRDAMHVAWNSGMPYAYALLRHGSRRQAPGEITAAAEVIDHIVANPSPSGLFWGQWTRGQGWNEGWTRVPYGAHSRTLAEAAFFLQRAARHERAHGRPRPAWEHAVIRHLDAAVAAMRDDGCLPSLFDLNDRTARSYEGAAGILWIAALAEATHLPNADQYVDAARRGGAYYAGPLAREYLNGAPEDVDLAPTSEDGYNALLAYHALWRVTRDRTDLDRARHAADWLLTFRYCYNVKLPPRTPLGQIGFRTLGADQASSCNQHLHPLGLVCLEELAALTEVTGDPYFLQRARENLACFRQSIAQADGDLNAYRGMAPERYYHTEWVQPPGMVLGLSHAWCIGILLLGCETALSVPALAG